MVLELLVVLKRENLDLSDYSYCITFCGIWGHTGLKIPVLLYGEGGGEKTKKKNQKNYTLEEEMRIAILAADRLNICTKVCF